MTNTKLENRWRSLSMKEMEALQMNQLRHFLTSSVIPFSRYYGEKLESLDVRKLKTWRDLERIPLSSKQDILPTDGHPDKPRDFVLQPDPKVLAKRPSTVFRALREGKRNVKRSLESEYRPILLTSTTGRSTSPVPFLFTQHDLNHLQLAGERLMRICGSRKAWRHVNLFPFAPHLAFWQAHYAGLGFGAFCGSTGGGKVMGTEGNVAFIDRIQPDALIGMPTFVYHVMQHAVNEDMHWRNIRKIVLGGEKVPLGLRRKLRELAARLGSGKVDVLSTYGFTEAKVAWPECPYSRGSQPSGHHIYPDFGIMEIIDPKTGEILPPETPGEIVYTPIDARGSVVLRYRTGDLSEGGLTYETCPNCGRTVPRILGKISRNSEIREMRLDKVKGTLVDFNQIEHVLDDASEIGAWQLEIRKKNDDPHGMDEVVLHVSRTHPESESEEKLADRLRNRMLQAVEIRPNKVVYHDHEEMQRMQGVGELLKEEKVIDNRERAGHELSVPSVANVKGSHS